ncbi:MAG: hypothetical protein ACYCVG_01775 [Leptospirillum sp.]
MVPIARNFSAMKNSTSFLKKETDFEFLNFQVLPLNKNLTIFISIQKKQNLSLIIDIEVPQFNVGLLKTYFLSDPPNKGIMNAFTRKNSLSRGHSYKNPPNMIVLFSSFGKDQDRLSHRKGIGHELSAGCLPVSSGDPAGN